jgi:hypothetical protein
VIASKCNIQIEFLGGLQSLPSDFCPSLLTLHQLSIKINILYGSSPGDNLTFMHDNREWRRCRSKARWRSKLVRNGEHHLLPYHFGSRKHTRGLS